MSAMEKENCTNDKQICRHDLARANGEGQAEKPTTETSLNLHRDRDFSTTCQETESSERKPLYTEHKRTCTLQKDGSRSSDRANREPSKQRTTGRVNTEEKDKMEQKEDEEETYEELICLVRQFYVERPVNPVAIGYHNIETC